MAMYDIATTERDSMCDALVDAIDAGSAGGTLEIFDSGDVQLAIMTFDPTAFGDSASGTATAATIVDEASAVASGTADYFVVSSSNSADTPLTTVFKGTVVAGGDMTLNDYGITAGDTVSCSSFTVAQPDA